jgi:hypothetical protein
MKPYRPYFDARHHEKFPFRHDADGNIYERELWRLSRNQIRDALALCQLQRDGAVDQTTRAEAVARYFRLLHAVIDFASRSIVAFSIKDIRLGDFEEMLALWPD